MNKLYTILLAFAPCLAFGQVRIVFRDYFQLAPVFSSDPRLGYTPWDETCCTWSFGNSDSFGLPVKSGRFELRKSDPSPQPNDSKRSQMEWNGGALKMGAVWYAMSIMPAPYSAIDPAPEDLFDLHDKMPNNAPSNWTNPFGIWNENGRWKVHITYSVNPVSSTNQPISKYYDLGPVVPGKFVDWILHTNYSWRDTGYVQLYKDGVLVIDYKGPCAYNGALPDPYFKFGIYKWPWASSTFQPPSTTTLRVFYVDNFRVGNRNATLADILLSPPVNTPPIANAGPDQTTAPGATSFTLSGSGTDADGVISGYLWETFLTPTGWMGTSTTAIWNISGAIAGKYGYKLTVTDDKGATGLDTCYVTIPALNAPPVITYISNDTYTLPIATANIAVTASDADGDSLSYTWRDSTGATVSFMPTFTVKFAKAGRYAYNVTISDGKTSTTGQAMIVINAVPPKLILSISSVLDPKTGGLVVTHYYADGTTQVYK